MRVTCITTSLIVFPSTLFTKRKGDTEMVIEGWYERKRLSLKDNGGGKRGAKSRGEMPNSLGNVRQMRILNYLALSLNYTTMFKIQNKDPVAI
jgi:hypothetical protein